MNKTNCLLLIIIISLTQPAVAVEQSPTQERPSQERPAQERPTQGRQDQTIRLKSELVEVRAVVTDKQGQPVGNLKKEDFELLENNRPQNISFFSVEAIGTQPGPDKPAEHAPLRARQEEPARTVVLFVDTVHISFENL